jgi:hypothetical protein
MKRQLITIISGCAAVLALSNIAGCSDTHQHAARMSSDSFALGTLGPATGPREPGVFALGAGDALGQAVFTNYVYVVQAQQRDAQQAVVGVTHDAQPQ